MLPDLDSLALFVRAAEMKNLTRAAEASLITVPAASRRLSLLEHQFKATLFERHSRGQMVNYARGRQSVLRVQGNTSAMTQFLPGDIASFSAAHEDVRVVLEECWSEDAVKRVRSGEVDLAVIVDGPNVSGLHVAPYRHDQLAVVMRNDDVLAGQTPLHFAELLARDLVGLEGRSTLTRLLQAQAALLLRPMRCACRCAASKWCAAPSRRSSASACCRWPPRAASLARWASLSSRFATPGYCARCGCVRGSSPRPRQRWGRWWDIWRAWRIEAIGLSRTIGVRRRLGPFPHRLCGAPSPALARASMQVSRKSNGRAPRVFSQSAP